MAESQVLVLGPEGVGKTLMLKRLQTISSQQNLPQRSGNPPDLGSAPSTIPTVGVNLATVTFNKQKITLRELGGVMGPIWANYFEDAGRLVYVVDAANRVQLASCCIQLFQVLAAENTHNMPVLLLFNKTDAPGCMSITELQSIMRLRDIKAFARQDITVVETSFLTGEGMEKITKWLSC